MPGYSETESPGFGIAEFTLNVQGQRLDVRTQLPQGPVRPAVLLPILQDLSNALSDLTVANAGRLGAELSCRAGCGACCRHAVPITAVEARVFAELLDALPAAQQKILRERFRRAALQLEESGVAQAIRDLSSKDGGREAAHEVGLRYFALGIPCPFLEEENCSIHEIRPLRCREYLVVSPAENCAHPETREIVSIQPPAVLSRILARWDANGDAQPAELILLTMLEEWTAHHPVQDDHSLHTAPELLQEFLQGFATDASAAPADPRTNHAPDLLPDPSLMPKMSDA
jgi:Fe-S-cluster containining protein